MRFKTPRLRLIVAVALLATAVFAPTRAGAVNGGPTLTNLSVSGVDVELFPAFSADVDRYSIYRSDATGAVSVTATATARITVNGTQVVSGVPFDVGPIAGGETISVAVSDPTGSNTYQLMYLPVDYPRYVAEAPGGPIGSGYLYLTRRDSFITILDNNAVPLLIREIGVGGTDFKRHPSGELWSARPTGLQNEFGNNQSEQVVLAPDLTEIGRFQTVGLNDTDSHDFLILPNGDYVFIAYNGEVRDGVVYEDSVIQQVDPTIAYAEDQPDSVYRVPLPGEVFRWSSEDAGFEPSDFPVRQTGDYAHANSVFLDDDGDFLVSLRGASQVLKIDTDTGDIVWKLGGVRNDFDTDDPLGGPCGQHTASRLANGNILIFDNGVLSQSTPCSQIPGYEAHDGITRAVEYSLDLTGPTPFASLVWSYQHPTQVAAGAGSTQRLSNGNTLIGWGGRPAEPIIATEVDAAGNVVFELSDAGGGPIRLSYRAQRFPLPDALALHLDDAFFSIDEADPAGTWVGTVGAVHPDPMDVTYAITGGNADGAFAIDSATGAITVAGPLDVATEDHRAVTDSEVLQIGGADHVAVMLGNATRVLTVTATAPGLSTTATVDVTIAGDTHVHLRDVAGGVLVSSVSFGSSFVGTDLEILPAVVGDPELAVLGTRADGVVRVTARDSVTGALVGRANYGNAYSGTDLEIVGPDAAVLGTKASNLMVRVQTRTLADGVVGSAFLANAYSGEDLEVLGTDVGVLGTKYGSGNVRVRAMNPTTGAVVNTAYWGNTFTGLDLEVRGGEWAVLQQRVTTGAVRVQTRSPVGGIVGTASFGLTPYVPVDLEVVGVDVAVLGVSTANQAVRVETRTVGGVLVGIAQYGTAYSGIDLEIVGGDVAVLGVKTSNGKIRDQIRTTGGILVSTLYYN